MNPKLAKTLAFFGVVFAIVMAAFNTFRSEWIKYKTDFPDEPEPEFDEDLSPEQMAAMQAAGVYQQPHPVEQGLVDPLRNQNVFQAPQAERTYTAAEVQAMMASVQGATAQTV